MDKSLFLLGAQEGAALVKSGAIRATEWMASCADRIEKFDPLVNAWAYFDRPAALRQAQQLDQKIASQTKRISLGNFCGVPVGIKDIFNTADMPTCMGSPIWEGFTPGNDARVVYYLRQSDAIIAGKTVTAEFAVHTPGKTRNPYQLAYSPGTSSSGSAAAVAAFMVPVALGTQTAGSIIRPASYCGIFGMKPSFGLIPRTGSLKTTDSLDTIGFFARNVDDLELCFETIRVQGPDYPLSHAFLKDSRSIGKKGQKLKIGVVTDSLWVWEKTTSYARVAFEDFVDEMSRSDIEIESLRLPSAFNSAHEIHQTIYDKTLSYYFKEEFKQHSLVSPLMYEIIRRGNQLSLEEYQSALEAQAKLASRLDQILSDWDAVMTLSTAGQAPVFGGEDIPDSCLIWTLCGVPVIHLPAFRSPSRMPFGVQILTRRYADMNLLSLAQEIGRIFLPRFKILPFDLELLAAAPLS